MQAERCRWPAANDVSKKLDDAESKQAIDSPYRLAEAADVLCLLLDGRTVYYFVFLE